MGILVGAEAIAVPLNILWWHEIVNLEFEGETLAVTHCPLTGSSLTFDRSSLDGAELGVSGLLFRNNLIMYDRRSDESLWPQMARAARCGTSAGSVLGMYASVEMAWGSWVEAHPGTRVVSSATGHQRDYRLYPYGSYDRIDNESLLFPIPIDSRRPPKERVLGIPRGTAGIAYPFGELSELGTHAVVDVEFQEQTTPAALVNVAVFWDAEAESAGAFSRRVGGDLLTFRATEGGILDDETGSIWGVDGVARSGPLAGTRLSAVAEAYVAYWFAWAAFAPNTEMWSAP